MTIVYIIIAILIFGVLITVHELGHFTAAKLCGVKVSQFAIGMGPAIYKKKRGETLYALRALPIGGFCAMGEDDGESDDPRAFVNKSWWKRTIILLAGAAMNFLAGFLVLLFIVPSIGLYNRPAITQFLPDSPYDNADSFHIGDEFYKIDGHRIYFFNDVAIYLERGNGVHDIEIRRGGERIVLENYDMTQKTEYINNNGESDMRYGFVCAERSAGFFAVFRNAWYASVDFVRMVWMGLGDLVTGAVGLKDLSGPVGIVSVISDAGANAESGTDAALIISNLAALIAINLAVMNLLPLPALDGGRVFFLLITEIIQKVTKKKLNPKYEAYIHTAGLALLLGLMAVVMFSDIYKLFK